MRPKCSPTEPAASMAAGCMPSALENMSFSFPVVKLQDMFSSADAMLAAGSVGEHFGRIYDNPYSTPEIKGLNLDFEVTNERRWARLESARTDLSEARPGDEITVEVLLRPYRGEAVIVHVPVRIPL